MVNLKEHIRICKTIAFMLLCLFSLSPCSTRQSILSTLNLDFTGTVNKTRASGNTINGCSFIMISAGKAAVSRSFQKLQKHQVHTDTNFIALDSLLNTSTLAYSSGLAAGNSPPKYILYKRLKVYLA